MSQSTLDSSALRILMTVQPVPIAVRPGAMHWKATAG
jgi:hypothetical protein